MIEKKPLPAKTKAVSSPKAKRSRTSFYSRVLTEAEKLEMEGALDITGIDEEIALLRVKIQSILEKEPENVRLIMNATNVLARLVRTRYKLEAGQGKGLKEAIGNVLKELAVPLGIKYLETKIK